MRGTLYDAGFLVSEIRHTVFGLIRRQTVQVTNCFCRHGIGNGVGRLQSNVETNLSGVSGVSVVHLQMPALQQSATFFR